MINNRNILTLDQGNTRGKLILFSGMTDVMSLSVDKFSHETLLPVFENYDIDGVAACYTTEPDVDFMKWLREQADGRLVIADGSCKLPFTNTYRTPHTLGADRIAAICGAVELGVAPASVVDCGTALTTDIIDADLCFRGGNISPGLSMRFKALSQFTGRLPDVDANGDIPEIGFDTGSAIRSGVVRGLVSEISGFYRMAQRKFGCENLLLTGGDCGLIYEYVSTLPGIRVEPQLVGKGLVALYNYNCNE